MGKHATGIYRQRNHRDSTFSNWWRITMTFLSTATMINIRRLMDTEKAGKEHHVILHARLSVLIK